MALNNFIAGTFLVLTIIQATMCTISPSTLSFFQEKIGSNLTKITWAHAVNNRMKLNETLADDKIMMIEADVVYGIDTTSNTSKAIMAHPPSNTSDLSLENFLLTVINDKRRGVKLDFKSIPAFDASLETLKAYHANMTFPVWLNADILRGPVNATTIPVNADEFLTKVKETFPESVLSIGWTTKYGKEFNITEGNYTQSQITEMIDTLSRNKVSQMITYPVRAGIAMNDKDLLNDLLNKTSKNLSVNATLTIWSSEDDYVDPQKLSKLIQEIGIDKVYVDVPEDLWNKLDVSAGPTTLASSLLLLGTVAIHFLLTKLI